MKIKSFKSEISDIKNVLIEIDKVNWNFSNLSGSQLQLFKGLDATQLQTYITQLQAAKLASKGIFDAAAVSTYADAIQGLEAKQAALLLSTQGLTNAQIAETLAVNESNVAKNYQAMVDAGLLVRKQKLTLAQVQENLQTVLGAEADTSAAMASLGLSAAIEGQEHQTVQLTTKKIQEAIATNALTQAQAQEFAMRTGVILSMQRQAVSVLPKWIATVKAATIAVLGQVKATAVWMATNPVGWITAAVAAIGGAIWAYKQLGDTVENAKEKVENATEKFNKATSELENIETELSNIESKIKELEALDSLTWVEQEELKRLREVTKELELQKQIKQETQLQTAEDLLDANKHLFEKEYKYFNLDNHDSNVRDVEEGLNTGRISVAQIDLDNIDDAIGTLRFLQKEKEKILTADTITKELQNQIDEYDEFMEDIKRNFSETLSSLSEYKQNILEIASIRDLTQDEQDFYDYLSSMQKAIYEYYSPATWNNLEFDSIFDTEGIEKTKEELVSMYKSGELSSAEMLEQFPKLNQAIKESEIIAGESSDVYKEFFNEIAALAEEQADAVNGIMDESKVSLSITETVDQINTQLKPAFDSLKSAYEDIFSLKEDTGEKLFSLDDVDISTFESIRSQLEKLGEIDGITIDYSPFERFVSVLSDTTSTAEEVQAQFDNLATSIIYTTDCANMSAETYDLLVKSLTEMGVTNVDEVLANLRDIQEELVSLGYDVADITAEEAAELIRLGAASAETTEYLKKYLVQKQLAQNPLNTMADITALEGLCNALGVTGELYRYVIDLKRAFDAKEMGAVSDGLDSSIEHIKGKIQELASGQVDFKFNFSTPGTAKSSSGSKSSSKKDTTKEFDWIEQAIENVEKEVKNLDDVVNSAYSTFSQKNEALAQEIGKVTEEIDLQQKAYDEYMLKAESISLSEEYKTLIRDGAINIENISDEKLQEKISEYQQWYEKAVDASDAISELSTKAKDLHVKGYELQTDRLEELLENEAITEKQYISEMTRLYKQYYENQTDYAVQAHKAKMALLDREKSYLNSVANAAASLFDKEISKVQDNAKEQAKVYKAQIKEAEKQKKIYQDQIKAEQKKIDAYNKEIDLINDKKKPLQDELDALEDKARHEDLILDLQKKQYELKRAENQKDKLVNYMPDTIVI